MEYGDIIKVVNNPFNRQEAAFKKLKKGEFPSYKVLWVSLDKARVEASPVMPNGKPNSYCYIFRAEEIMPERLLDKKLEDYM